MLAKQPFAFVTAKLVEKLNGDLLIVSGTNNEAEWTLRSPAQARARAAPTRRWFAHGPQLFCPMGRETRADRPRASG